MREVNGIELNRIDRSYESYNLMVMMKSWFRYLLVGYGLLMAAMHSGAQTVAEPRLEAGGLEVLRAVAMRLVDEGDSKAVLRLSLFVQNVSDRELTLVTGNTGVTIVNYEVPLYQMGLNAEKGYNGVTLLPSIYRFYPVTLRPQEGAVITVDHPLQAWHDVGKPIEGKEGAYITVGYTITPSFAERFNLWQGTLVSEPVLVGVGRKTPLNPREIQELRQRSATAAE